LEKKFFVVLNANQKKELKEFVSEYAEGSKSPCFSVNSLDQNLTEIKECYLYVCLEQRLVRVQNQVVTLTAKEFDILALLIQHPK